jgi:hypothetical protein
MGMPPRLDTVQFRRKISDEERAVLLAAGNGDITVGFKEVLRVYMEMYNLGFKRDMSVFDFVEGVDMVDYDQELVDDSSAS